MVQKHQHNGKRYILIRREVFAFLQPMAIHENMDLSKTAMHETRDAKEGILEFRKMAQQDARGLYTTQLPFLMASGCIYR